jgi:ABC-type molybdenum transport system ATPase subunit/photorepair protein PhrA
MDIHQERKPQECEFIAIKVRITPMARPQSKMTIKLETHIEANMVVVEPTLLEKIDKLFACNVGEYINLPQLVVVGDQSSGKSSVLEGLTKLKFPRNSGLCTRFATQIIFRRDPSLKIRKVSGSIISTTRNEGKEKPSWCISDIEILNEREFENMMTEVFVSPSQF